MNKKNISNNEEVEKQRKKLLLEMNQLDNEIKKIKRKRIITGISICLLIVVIIKVFFGTIQIYNIFGYPSSKARFYKLTVNNEPITVAYESSNKLPLIPFLINLESTYLGSSYINGDDSPYFDANDSKEYIIDISSYSCYSNNIDGYQIECKNENQNKRKNNDTKYIKLTITRTTNPYEVVYEGNYIGDITEYVDKPGVYCVEIIAKHHFTESKVYFYFRK